MPSERISGSQTLRARLARAATLGGLGITPRLVIAFLSVALLAAAANFLVKNGAFLAQQVIESVGPRDAAQAAETARGSGLADERYRAASARVQLALERLSHAVRAHVDSRLPPSRLEYEAALGELARAADAKLLLLPEGSPLAAEIQQTVHAQRRVSSGLIQAVSQRRTASEGYAATLAGMSARLQDSIDRAWKIMGRVVARQSLLKLGTELDAIQAAFTARDIAAARTGSALAAAEQAFANTLQKGEASLRRSQGEEWLRGMREDLSRLAALRGRASQAETSKTKLAHVFASDARRLMDALAREPGPLPASATPAMPDASVVATPVSAEAAQPAATSSFESETPSHALVAWVSFAVLAILAYISVATIISVVRPVRRLVKATARLARGQEVQPLEPGGIRELDTLGRAFNVMAEQLAAVRQSDLDVQRELEGKVEERTRELKTLAERDPLTGLANRRQLFSALSESIEQARTSGRRVGAFFLDIDNFKTLNDSLGHAFGDRVLTAIAQRLEHIARSFVFAARLGGDEFMLVHEDAESADDILRSGNAIIAAFQEPLEVEGRELIVSVSVGASIYPDHERDAEALMQAADAALFSAKALGRSQLSVFTPELLETASAKFAIEQRLRRAIEKREFELFYQPEVDLATLEVTAVEALIRWRMPDGGYQCPADFIAVAEESGLISEINDWVLRSACEAAAGWHHGLWPQVRVAINVSPRQFLDLRFTDKLRTLLEEFRLPPRCIELELTESVLQTGAATIRALTEVRSMGVAIALDDFGTGYSSLSSLEQLPLTRVKLDRSLIARMDSNPRSASIARATIGLCSELGLEVTAEGVERPEQFSALLEYRPMSIQGYLLARPVPRDAVPALLLELPAACEELVLAVRPPTPIKNIRDKARSSAFANSSG